MVPELEEISFVLPSECTGSRKLCPCRQTGSREGDARVQAEGMERVGAEVCRVPAGLKEIGGRAREVAGEHCMDLDQKWQRVKG